MPMPMLDQGRKAEIEALIRKKMGLPPAQAMASTQNPMHGAEEQTEDPNAPDPDDMQGPPPVDEAALMKQPQPPAPPGAQGYGGQPGILEMAQMGDLGQIAPVSGGVPGMIQNNQDQYGMLAQTPVNGQMASQQGIDMAQPQQGRPSPSMIAAVMRMLSGGPQQAQAKQNMITPQF